MEKSLIWDDTRRQNWLMIPEIHADWKEYQKRPTSRARASDTLNRKEKLYLELSECMDFFIWISESS